jgi:hypothetical protein
MRTLIYKRTHSGDPDPNTGVFGNHDCMGGVRGWPFDAVIGIGGVGQEPQKHRIAGKLTWVGIGPQAINHSARGPELIFHHFWYRGDEGLLLETSYPVLASRMYDKNVRVLVHSPSFRQHQDSQIAALDREIDEILRLAIDAPSSTGPADRDLGRLRAKCSVPLNRGAAAEIHEALKLVTEKLDGAVADRRP